MRPFALALSIFLGAVIHLGSVFGLQTPEKIDPADWNQWRGPSRSGVSQGAKWPDSLDESKLKKIWSVPLGPSYSGPIVVGDRVFTTETKDKKFEIVTAFERSSGKKLWSAQWEGSMTVPFFARANGDWIRSTPVYDDGRLYVGGIKDVIVCLDAESGNEIWKVDFPAKFKSEIPSFGFVCSPMIDGDHLYVQAGESFCKLRKSDGELVWKSLQDGGGMNGSAFASPVIETIAGVRQAVVQTRTKLCGVDLDSGSELWSQEIPSFRGMNIMTPIVSGDSLFVSTYGGTTQLINVSKTGDAGFALKQAWNNKAQGYMNTPVVNDGHAYIHLRNQRYACYDLATGEEKWRSKPKGKYASMVARGDKILSLEDTGELLMIKATPAEYQVLSSRKVASDSWAHLAVRGNQIFVRDLAELIAFEFVE